MRKLSLLLLSFLFCFSVSAHEKEKNEHVVFMYIQNTLFSYQENGVFKGVMGDYLTSLMDEANIAHEVMKVYSPFQLLFSDRPNYCFVSALKSKEREKKLLFTSAVGVSDDYVVVGRADNKQLLKYKTVEQLMTSKRQEGATIHGAIYGSYLTPLIKKYRLDRKITFERLLTMTQQGKVDYFFLTPTIAKDLVRRNQGPESLKVYDHFSDLKNTKEFFYIACSKNTDPDIIVRMNAIIDKRKLIPSSM